MALQNRVDPLGRLIATPARGSWLGNRGLLHDGLQRVRRPWRLKAWLICLLEFKGRGRAVMSPGLYTELFFLDEATALSAGHRPCCECRRAAYLQFKGLAGLAGGRVFARAADLDEAIHADRLRPDGSKRTYAENSSHLPDGVFIMLEGAPWLKHQDRLHRWTPQGYTESRAIDAGEAEVLTPRLTVAIIRAGYAPQIAL